MKVELTTTNQCTFGMALSRPSNKKITQNIGMLAANEFELAQPRLESLAQNIDIKISIIKATDFASKGFKIIISDTVKNPIRKLLGMYDKHSQDVMMGEVIGGKANLSELLPRRTAQLKQKYFPQ